MTPKTFGFKEQLKVGDEGEQLILKAYPGHYQIAPGNIVDLVRVRDSATIELKTDTYDIEKTVNFFIEFYSDINRRKVGGPFRALTDHVDEFWYLFIVNRHLFQFNDIPKLIVRIIEIANLSKLCYIGNRGWMTMGWKLPRTEFKDLYEETIVEFTDG